ncbi:hypothetical protein AVEN_64113-1 [Araneus ventricosus]|uniref:Testis-expressed protein 9 n=1 Tax=Araneus ventricosus TaxID=182803 RepID=A0A4Y2C437_ARAVE|nr:hypothetical protein AVEN_64113-1 [Araneus ventricosus]
MDAQIDDAVLEEAKIHEENLECESLLITNFSEENTLVSDKNSVKGENTRTICEISEESEIRQENVVRDNLNKIYSNQSDSIDVNELLTKSNDIIKKKFQMSGTTSEKGRNRQEKPINEKFNKINLNDLNITGGKGMPSHGNVVKRNNNAKEKLCAAKVNKVNFQLKFKKPDVLKNNSIKNDYKETNSTEKQLSIQNTAASSLTNIVLQSPSSIASGDTQSKHLLDYGFKHLKEEMKALIQQCAEKEDTIESLEKLLRETEQSHSDMKKKCLHLEQKKEKLSKNLEEITKKHDKAEQDLSAANSFIAEAKQTKKIADNTISDLEKRLGQTLAQKERLKSKLDAMNLGGKNAQMSSQKQIEELTETNKLLSRQKSELREVVIKQMQLVNNLKRQLLHLKAGMAQNYTEQEVMKVVDEFY